MAVSFDPDQWLKRLTDRLTRQKNLIAKWDAYYEGIQPLAYLAPELVVEMGDRLRPVILNWPRLVVDSIERRMDVEGFRLPSEDDADAELWRIWQANDLDEESSLAHVDALVMGRAYAIVGSNLDEPETPIITVESPLDAYVEPDPVTRKGMAGIKMWSEDPATGAPIDHCSLYLPNSTTWYVKQAGKWVIDPDYPPDNHDLGAIPIVPIVNRGRVRNRLGVSELFDVVPLSDAACKLATDMLVSAEFHAMPRRYAIGMAPQDFQDSNGNPLSTWSTIAGRLWATDKPATEVKVDQFPEAQLTNFIDAINMLAGKVASITGLDAQALGLNTANPASADAIRSAESPLIKEVKRKERSFGGSWEQVMRLADQFANGVQRPELRALETLWADPQTPTVAESADAAVKLFNLPQPIVPLRQTREDLGYTQTQIARMEEEDAKQQAQDLANFKMETAAQMQSANTPIVDTGAGNVPADNGATAQPAAA